METEFFPYDHSRAREAAAFVLERQGQIGRLRLIKLLYLADRESLRRRGHPICGGRYVSMKHGPVLSSVLDDIRLSAQRVPGNPWNGFIEASRDTSLVKFLHSPPASRLTSGDRRILQGTLDEFGGYSDAQLYEYVHSKLQEYVNPERQGARVLEIEVRALLRILGFDEDGAADALRDAAAQEGVRRAVS